MLRVFSTENFDSEVLNAQMPVLVKFWNYGCTPCTMMEPVMEEAEKKFSGQALVGNINVSDNMNLAIKYQIMAVPTMILFKDGQPVAKKMGYMDIDELDEYFSPNF